MPGAQNNGRKACAMENSPRKLKTGMFCKGYQSITGDTQTTPKIKGIAPFSTDVLLRKTKQYMVLKRHTGASTDWVGFKEAVRALFNATA